MEGILLNTKQKNDFFDAVEEYFSGTKYGSLEGFTAQTKRNIAPRPLLKGMFMLSMSIFKAPLYADLEKFVKAEIDFKLTARPIPDDLVPKPTEI